jgi:hypothetical protein
MVQMLVGTPCCPPPDLICEGRPILEDAVLEGGHACVETVPYCNVNVDGCGGEAALPGIGLTCCPQDIGTCDICQGRPILDVVLETGYSCAETVPFCNDNAAQCEVMSCEEIEGSIGPLCCPASDASETPSDASEAPDGSETPPDESCDICQGVPLNESAVIDGGATCGDTIPYCNGNPAACGATCADLTLGLGLVCCGTGVVELAVQSTEQPIQQQSLATEATEEEGDGFNSGAVIGANAKLTMLLVLTVSRLLC